MPLTRSTLAVLLACPVVCAAFGSGQDLRLLSVEELMRIDVTTTTRGRIEAIRGQGAVLRGANAKLGKR